MEDLRPRMTGNPDETATRPRVFLLDGVRQAKFDRQNQYRLEQLVPAVRSRLQGSEVTRTGRRDS